MWKKLYSNNKSIVKNTGYLSVLEFLKLIMPFIALPYIIRVVGIGNYGLVAFAQVIISYFIVLVNFGLDISAVKLVAENRNNVGKLNEIVSSVLIIKGFLFLVSLPVLWVLMLTVEQIGNQKPLFFFTYLTCLSEVLFPAWYYQGVEKMKYITIIRFSSILFYVVAVFAFIRKEGDYILVPLIQSVGWFISGALSFFTLLKVEKIRLLFPSLKRIRVYFMDSVPFFVSRVSLAINGGMAKTVTGFYFTPVDVGIFDLAQKIATVAILPVHMLCQAVYPHIAKTKDYLVSRSYLYVVLGLSAVVVTAVYLLAPTAVCYLTGRSMPEAVLVLRVLGLYIFFGGLSVYLGYPTLVAFGHPKPFNRSVLFSTLILFVLYGYLYLTHCFSVINFSIVLGLAELSIAAYRVYYCNKLGVFKGRCSSVR